MANTILMKSLTTAATVPHATNGLKIAELGVNTYDGRIYLGTKIGASGTAGGTATAATWVGAPILDEDDLTSNSATSLATQQSIKAYIDSNAGTGDITGVVLTTDDSNTASDTSGSAAFTIAGGAGIDTSASGTTVTIAGETASATNAGIVELATTAETTTGTDAARAVTPDGLKDGYQGSTNVTTLGTIGTGTWQGTAIANGYIAADAVTGGKIADDAVDSEHIVDGSIDLAHMSSESVDEDNLYISNSGSNGQFLQKQSGNNGGLTWATAATSNTTYTAGDGLDLSGTEFSLELSTSSNIGGVIVAGTANEVDVSYSSGTATVGLPSDVTIGNDLTVTGDLTVNGDTTTVNTATLSVEDPLIILASGNSADSVDVGMYAKYVESSTTKYAGMFRDASATGDPWVFFDGLEAAPTTTVNTSGTGYDLADISAGSITAADGLTGTLQTASQTNITGVGTISTGVWNGTAIASSYIAADAITGAKIADDAIDSEHYTDGSIDTAHIADNQVTLAKMAGLARGKIIYGDASGDPAALAAGANGKILVADANGDLSWTTLSGDATLSAGALTIASGSIENAMLAGSIANSKLANDGITIAGVDCSLGDTISAATIAAAIDSETMTLTNTTMDGGTYSTS